MCELFRFASLVHRDGIEAVFSSKLASLCGAINHRPLLLSEDLGVDGARVGPTWRLSVWIRIERVGAAEASIAALFAICCEELLSQGSCIAAANHPYVESVEVALEVEEVFSLSIEHPTIELVLTHYARGHYFLDSLLPRILLASAATSS